MCEDISHYKNPELSSPFLLSSKPSIDQEAHFTRHHNQQLIFLVFDPRHNKSL